jgi:hypothetical protein
MASLDDELAEIAATEARLAARARGEEPPAEAYVPTQAVIERSVEFARKAPHPYATTTILIRTVRATSVAAPRRQATTSSRRRSRTTSRAGSSRDGPGLGDDSDEPPDLEHLRPLTAVARAYLRAEVDRRRREVVAAQPEISPEVFHLYDGDRRS